MLREKTVSVIGAIYREIPVFERYQKISPTHNDSSCHQKILIQTVTLVSFKTVSNLSSVKSLI